jgi:hypothetical protein
VQTSSAQESVLFQESGFQSVLAGANSGGVAGRSTADDGDVINGFRQENTPYNQELMSEGKRTILEQQGESSKGRKKR